MAFNFSACKALARRTVHTYLSVGASYAHPTLAEPVELRVRWHNKIARYGDLEDGGYAEIVEGINRLIFDAAELDEKGVVPAKGALVTLTDPEFNNAVLVLDTAEPRVGPIEVIWGVVPR